MKKTFNILLVCILFFAFNIKANADDEKELVITGGQEGIDYTYEDGLVTINNSNNYEISMADGVEQSTDRIIINYSDTLKSITLTLNNVNLKTDLTENILIKYPNQVTDDLEVNLILKGNNTLTAANHPFHNPLNIGTLTISSSDGGTLTTEALKPPSGYNNINSNRFVLESGTLTMKNQIIMTTTGIYIKGGELNITSQDESLYSNGEIIISGGNTILTSESGCAINMVGTNTSAASGGLQIIGDANVTMTTTKASSATIFAGNRAREDILIDTTGKVNINSKYIGIVLNKNSNLTINNGTINITGPTVGVYANASAGSVVTVNGGETEIISKSYGFHLQSATQKTITFGDEYSHKNYQGTDAASRTEVNDETLIIDGKSTKYVLITPVYNIDYNLGNGSLEEGKENPTKYTRVDTFTLNNPSKEEYTFTGWTGTGVEGSSTSVTIAEGSTGNRTYTANYEPITYTISYELNGGGLPSGITNPTTYVVTNTPITLNNPSKEGYTFTGWTGTDLDALTKNVTIAENSTGNRSYVAHYNVLSHIDRVEATCTKNGNIEYYQDEANDKYYIDEDLQNEIAEEDTIIPATDHDWGEWVITKEATYTETGLKTRICNNDPTHIETEIIPIIADDIPETSDNIILNLMILLLSFLGISYSIYLKKIV